MHKILKRRNRILIENSYQQTKADIGLSAVNNTADADKIVSSPQQTALDLKATISQMSQRVPKTMTINSYALSVSSLTLVASDIPNAESVLNKDTDNTLSSNSDTKYPSQKAVKGYVDDGLLGKQSIIAFTPENISNKATDLSSNDNTHYPTTAAVQVAINNAVTGLLDFRGSFNASSNVFPSSGGSGTAGAIVKSDFWICSVGGTIGGSTVTPGDLIIAIVDTPGQTFGNWNLVDNLSGYVSENVVNKDTDGTLAANSDTKYASQKATKTYADTGLALKVDNVSGKGLSVTGQSLLDFGSVETDIAILTVAASWVTNASYIQVSPFPKTTADHDPDDYIAEQLLASVKNVIVGVSFDIVLHAPNKSFGKYYINFMSN